MPICADPSSRASDAADNSGLCPPKARAQEKCPDLISAIGTPAFTNSPTCASASLARSEDGTGLPACSAGKQVPFSQVLQPSKIKRKPSSRQSRTIERSVGNLSSKNKSLKQSPESAHLRTQHSRANVSPYSLYQPMQDHQLSTATANCYQRLLSSYQISTMPSLRETRLVRLHRRRTNLHLYADQQRVQRYVAQWRQYLPPQPSLPGCQPPNKQKASATSN